MRNLKKLLVIVIIICLSNINFLFVQSLNFFNFVNFLFSQIAFSRLENDSDFIELHASDGLLRYRQTFSERLPLSSVA